MKITREQYEADIRKAKAQALRDLANSLEHDALVDYWLLHETADELDH